MSRDVEFFILTIIFLFVLKDISLSTYYLMCFLLGTGTGYWAIFVTIAAEQFGTNIRSTVASTVPNFVRGSTVPIVLTFKYIEPTFGVINSALLIGGVTISIAIIALAYLPETFGKNLNFIEE